MKKWRWESSLFLWAWYTLLYKSKVSIWQENFTSCERQETSNGSSLIVLHFVWPEPQRRRGGSQPWIPPPLTSHETYCWDVASNCVIYNTMSSPSCVCASCFNHMCSFMLFGFMYRNKALIKYHFQRRIHES